MKPRALLAALLLTAGLTPLVAPGPATAAPITKAQLLTLDEVESVFPQLLERRDDANQDRFRFGMDAPAYWTSPLRCDHTRLYKGTSRATANTYTLLGPSFNFLESIVQFRTTHQARSVLQHYRDYARVCRGRHATDDGDGGAATLEVRAWRPGRGRRRASRPARRLHRSTATPSGAAAWSREWAGRSSSPWSSPTEGPERGAVRRRCAARRREAGLRWPLSSSPCSPGCWPPRPG